MTAVPTSLPSWRAYAPRALIALVILIAATLGWQWWAAHWRPDSADWPTQGIAIGPDNIPLRWPSIAMRDIAFAYIDATVGASPSHGDFTNSHDAALSAGLRVGPIHHYRLCAPAMDQAAAFVRLVPREATALPPLVMLGLDEDCPRQPTRALLLSELSTFLTQIETHMGKSAIIAPDTDFEERFAVIAAINRPIMVQSARAVPDADGPAWLLWLANDRLRIDGSTGATRLLVLGNGIRRAQ